MVGSLHNFKYNPSRETIELIENSTLISINLKQIKPLMFSNIQIANFINAIIEDYALFLEDKIYFSQMMSSIDKYLILLDKEPQIFQRIPLTYIASFLGISRETLSRLRAKWFCDICQMNSFLGITNLQYKNDNKDTDSRLEWHIYIESTKQQTTSKQANCLSLYLYDQNQK